MFFSIRLRGIVAIAIVVAVLSLSFAASVPTAATGGKTIVIDAGHGGQDGGVVGASGVKESEINLAIAIKLKKCLISGGYNVVMTRESDTGLYGNVSTGKKLADMKKRKSIINQARPTLMVSIHQNYYPSSYVKGAQVFYAPDGKSKDEAEHTQRILNRMLGCKREAMKGDYYVLQCSQYPSLLIECGFVSNPDEEKKLVSASYQEEVAYAIYTAICFSLTGSSLA